MRYTPCYLESCHCRIDFRNPRWCRKVSLVEAHYLLCNLIDRVGGADPGPDVSSYMPARVSDNSRASVHIHAPPILPSFSALRPNCPFIPFRPTQFLFVTITEIRESDIPFPRSSAETVHSTQRFVHSSWFFILTKTFLAWYFWWPSGYQHYLFK